MSHNLSSETTQDHDDCYSHPIRNSQDLIAAFSKCKAKSTKNSNRAFHSVSDVFIQDTIDFKEDLEDLQWTAKTGEPSLSSAISLYSHKLSNRMGFINGSFGAERQTRDLLRQTRAELVSEMSAAHEVEVRRAFAVGMMAILLTSVLLEVFHQHYDWKLRFLALAVSSLFFFAAFRLLQYLHKLAQYLREIGW